MSATRTWLLIGVVLAAGVGVARMLDPGRPRIASGGRVYLVGDSLAQGLLPPLRQEAADADVELRGRGVRSTRIRDWTHGELQQALQADLQGFDPDLVLVSLGTNDFTASPEAVADSVAELLEELSAHRIVWVLPPTYVDKAGNDRLATVRDIIRQKVANAFPSDELEIPRAPDGLHPTAKGYSGWAAAIWQWLS